MPGMHARSNQSLFQGTCIIFHAQNSHLKTGTENISVNKNNCMCYQYRTKHEAVTGRHIDLRLQKSLVMNQREKNLQKLFLIILTHYAPILPH